jgi:beta-lactamase class A
MSFYRTTPASEALGRALVDGILVDNAGTGLVATDLGVTIVLYGLAGVGPIGYAHNGTKAFYPCSVIKMFWLAACHARLEEGFVAPHPELERALHDMIAWSSNTATNYVIDLVTGTTGDTLLDDAAFSQWADHRQWLNRWIRGLDWPEMAAINICQKNMDDDRYGREKQNLDAFGHNRLTTDATARLFHEIFEGAFLPAPRRAAMRRLLSRRHDRDWVEAHPHAQVSGYLGAALPPDARLWSKAGWTAWTGDAAASYRRHDAARVEVPGFPPFLLVVFTQGRAASESLTILPGAAARALALVGRLSEPASAGAPGWTEVAGSANPVSRR